MSMNIIILQGRLVRDPSVKKTESGTSVTSFTIAVDRDFKKGNDAIADFIDCTAWRATADFIGKHFTKGDSILVKGSLQSRKWVGKDDQPRTAWEVIVEGVNFCGPKASGSTPKASNVDASDFEELDDSDELPF